MTLAPRSVPITMGSPTFRTLDLHDFTVVHAWFPPDTVLDRHRHERASVAVTLDGSFTLGLTGHSHHCPPTAVFTEPLGEPHANYMGPRGAHVVVIQPDPARLEFLRPFAGFRQPHPSSRRRNCHVGRAAGAGARRHRRPVAAGGRGNRAGDVRAPARLDPARSGRPPAWLLRAQELLHDRFSEPLHSSDIASAVEVHPAHLGRAFRAHFNVSMGSYVRRLRLDWAARQLTHSAASLAAVAMAAGFADQSHFTRAFKRYTGLTPNAYRRTTRC